MAGNTRLKDVGQWDAEDHRGEPVKMWFSFCKVALGPGVKRKVLEDPPTRTQWRKSDPLPPLSSWFKLLISLLTVGLLDQNSIFKKKAKFPCFFLSFICFLFLFFLLSPFLFFSLSVFFYPFLFLCCIYLFHFLWLPFKINPKNADFAEVPDKNIDVCISSSVSPLFNLFAVLFTSAKILLMPRNVLLMRAFFSTNPSANLKSLGVPF